MEQHLLRRRGIINRMGGVLHRYGVDHIIQEISGAFDLSDCTLLQGRAEVAHESYAKQLKDMGGEGTETLLDTLFISDICIDLMEYPKT